MGVLKIRENKDLYEQDPFEMFSTDEPWDTKPQEGPQPVRRQQSNTLGFILIGLLVIGVTSLVTYLSATRNSAEVSQKPYAYLELKVLNADGRPVPGANVATNAKSLGLTDSFGEWRRFMRVALGESMALEVTKSMDGKTRAIVKNLLIPTKLPTIGELEVKASIQFEPTEVAAPNARLTAEKASDQLIQSSIVDTKAAPKGDSGYPDIVVRDYDAVWFDVENPATTPENQSSQARATELKTLVLNSMKTRSRQLGLKIGTDAKWVVKIQHLDTPEKNSSNINGLISVTSYYGGKQEYSFLRNYTADSMATARGILYGITKHAPYEYITYSHNASWYVGKPSAKLWDLSNNSIVINGSSREFKINSIAASGDYLLKTSKAPCGDAKSCVLQNPNYERNFPAKNLSAQSVRIYGVTPDTQIYVGGYAANLVSGDIWQYFGKPEKAANVTAVQQGRVVYRGKVNPNAGKRAILSIPQSMMSKR